LELLAKEDYDNLRDKKELPVTVFVMNEFFDALPTTVLEYTEQGWREKVVAKGIDPEYFFIIIVRLPLELKNSSRELHQKFTPKVEDPKIGDKIEVSHESLITMDTMAKLLARTKGAILNIDYGA
jgi:SAM-dependent MidA family methyltransferase